MSSEELEKAFHGHDEGSQRPDLSQEHHDFLLDRHGRVNLDPLPSMDLSEPLNWHSRKKDIVLIVVAFHCMSTTFMAAGLTPAFETMALKYGKAISDISYLTSVQIVILGILPMFWLPVMNTYGYRPLFIISAAGAMACNIGGGFCTTYGQQMATRALTAFFISPATAVGSRIVAKLYFSHERARKTGWWALPLTLGTPGGPFIMGFVEYHAGTKWIYFVFAIMNFVLLVGHLLFVPETNFVRDAEKPTSTFFSFKKLSDDVHLSWKDFFTCLQIGKYYQIMIPIISYSIVFCFANIALIVEMPQVFGEKFHLNAQQMGLQYLALIIGSVIGELVSGPFSDWWMDSRTRKSGGERNAVDRLWLSYPGFITVIVGLVVWGVRLQQAEEGVWNITPLVGAAIASFGNQIITTTLITFSIDCLVSEATDTGLMINLVRQTWGFIGPFYFPKMFDNLGFGGAGCLMAGLVGVCAGGPIILLHLIGRRRDLVVS